MKHINTNTNDQLLTVTVMPDKTIVPEWINTDSILSETTVSMQNEIIDRYSRNPESWLFYLGFFEPISELSLSLRYFMALSGLFIKKLSRIPEIETLRDQATMEISDLELDQFLERTPMMSGAD